MRLTLFQSLTDPTAPTYDVSWPELVARLETPATYADKYLCPLIKLAVFGNVRSPKGMLRNDSNVSAITGIELDYDGERLTIDDGAQLLARAGVRCLLYTSATHKPAAPRWRALIPLGAEYPPEYRKSLYEAANAIVGGICDPVSATLSQSYFIGAVDGVDYRCVTLDGQHLDDLVEPRALALDIASGDVAVPEWRRVELDALPIDDDTRRLIRDGAPKGERSEALMSVANALARARIPRDDIVRVLADPAYGISAKALTGRRQQSAMEWLAKHTVAKAMALYPSPESAFAEPVGFGSVQMTEPLFIVARDLTAEYRPIDWLIRDIVERPVLGVLFGDPGAGKSFVAIDWAASIATGREWNGRKVTAGPVAYIAGEGYGGMARRLKAWEVHHGVALGDAPLFVSRRGVAFNDARAVADLHGQLDAMSEPPKLIVIDTLARATPGMDENLAKEMGAFVGACDRLREKYGATVIVVHHSGHADKGRAKGSIALKGAVDFEAAVLKTGVDGVIRLTPTKMKEGEPFADVALRFERVDLPWVDDDLRRQSSAVLVVCDMPEQQGRQRTRRLKLTPSDQLLMTILGTEPIAKDKVRETFMQMHPAGNDDAREQAFYRSMRRGNERGWFNDDGHTLTPIMFAIMRDQRGETTDND